MGWIWLGGSMREHERLSGPIVLSYKWKLGKKSRKNHKLHIKHEINYIKWRGEREDLPAAWGFGNGPLDWSHWAIENIEPFLQSKVKKIT